ncbi:hypothetical protein B0H13DRAFT_1954016, partial [Mycena leptocephala]
MIPPAIAALPPPTPGFTPCEIPSHLGANFKDHVQFSCLRNKTYWVLFANVKKKHGVYSLKTTCLGAKGSRHREEDVIGSFDTWAEVLPVWATNCFHRHEKCKQHPAACAASVCPDHPAPLSASSGMIRVLRVKEEAGAPVKREPLLKQEEQLATTPARTRRVTAKRGYRSREPPSYTPVPETDVGSDVDSDGMLRGGTAAFRPRHPRDQLLRRGLCSPTRSPSIADTRCTG